MVLWQWTRVVSSTASACRALLVTVEVIEVVEHAVSSLQAFEGWHGAAGGAAALRHGRCVCRAPPPVSVRVPRRRSDKDRGLPHGDAAFTQPHMPPHARTLHGIPHTHTQLPELRGRRLTSRRDCCEQFTRAQPCSDWVHWKAKKTARRGLGQLLRAREQRLPPSQRQGDVHLQSAALGRRSNVACRPPRPSARLPCWPASQQGRRGRPRAEASPPQSDERPEDRSHTCWRLHDEPCAPSERPAAHAAAV